jgi:tellurite resistance protein TerC
LTTRKDADRVSPPLMTFALAVQATEQTAKQSIGTPVLWAGFLAFVVLMLLLDLGVFHRTAHAIRIREAVMWTVVWITLALVFNAGILLFGPEDRKQELAIQFLTGYLIEKALSVDNIFVFIIIFSFFRVPPAYQHRVLFWGILGALVMRGIFIWIGRGLLQFKFMVYVFGAFLIITGIRILLPKKEEFHPERHIGVRLFRKLFPVAPATREGKPVDYGPHFLTKIDGRTFATPLFMVLFVVEITDLLFAVDSIPAIVAISDDPFIIYTSNIFAILGLRALYFVVGGMMDRFHYLKFGLGLILVFIGIKMVGHDFLKVKLGVNITPVISLAVVVVLLAGAIALSLVRPRKEGDAGTPP